MSGKRRIGDVRFIPHRPVAHLALVAGSKRFDPAVPRLKPFLARRESGSKIPTACTRIDGIAIACLKQNVEPLRTGVIYHLVQPTEIELAGFRLTASPSRLYADGLDAQRRKIVGIRPEIRITALDRLASERPGRIFDILHRTRSKRSDSFKRH